MDPSETSIPLVDAQGQALAVDPAPLTDIGSLLKNLENGVVQNLQAVITNLQKLVQQSPPVKETLIQEEQRLISLSQINMIVKSLTVLLLPTHDPQRKAQQQKLADEIAELETQIQDSIQRENSASQRQAFFKQLEQAKQQAIARENEMKQRVIKQEKDMAEAIQKSYETTLKTLKT